MLGDSLEAPHQGASNEYTQDMFLRRKKKQNKKTFLWILSLIWSNDAACHSSSSFMTHQQVIKWRYGKKLHTCHKLWTKICEIRQNFKGDLTKFCEIFSNITFELPQYILVFFFFFFI